MNPGNSDSDGDTAEIRLAESKPPDREILLSEGDAQQRVAGIYCARSRVGIFIGFAVPIGFQIAAAVPLAFLLKGAKIPAVVLTFISNYATVLVIYPLQCYIGGFLIFRPFRWAVLVEKLHGCLKRGRLRR